MHIYQSSITLRGAELEGESILPVLRDRGDAKDVKATKEVEEKYPNIGGHANYRVLPYTMQNKYGRVEKTLSLTTIVCENEHLKATFLPEYGGRLYSLFHKKYQRQLLHVNPVFQPANLAMRNAWFSGGIEWNVGHFGHSCLTCESVFFGTCIDEHGRRFLRLYEYERMKKLFYHIDFYLSEDADVLASYVRIINPYDEPAPLYYWSNIAVDEKNNARVFSERKKVIYMQPIIEPDGRITNTFACGTLPHLQGLEGDVSYVENFPRANEYFYQNEDSVKFPWEAVAYDDGFVFYECSTQPLRYRKMFCWGEHRGGKKWQEYLSRGEGEKYFEVQAGLAPTQLHAGMLAPKSEVAFMQVFGGLHVEDARGVYGDLDAATQYIKGHIFDEARTRCLEKLESTLQAGSRLCVKEVLCQGRGWAHLECMRMRVMGEAHEMIEHLVFPEHTLDAAQEFWKNLLLCYARGGKNAFESMRQFDVEIDALSYVVDTRWKVLLERARNQDEKNEMWYSLHMALLHYENSNVAQALGVLERACFHTNAPIMLRTLGAMHAKGGNIEKALYYYEKAYVALETVKANHMKEDLMCEYMQLLYDTQHYVKLWQCYESMMHMGWVFNEESRVIVALCAFELKKWTELEEFFAMNFERIREGDNRLCELWFKKKAHDIGSTNMEEIRKSYTPPENIDFRLA